MTDNNNNEDYFERENHLLEKTLIEIDSTNLGKVEINGSEYTKVSKRLEILRKNFGFNIRIMTEIIHMDETLALIKAIISVYKNGSWETISTGHSEKRRNDSEVNRMAALENAETSAIGRALANLGISGAEYASLDELIISFTSKGGSDKNTVNKADIVSNSEDSTEKTNTSSKTKLVTSSEMSFILKLVKSTNSKIEDMLTHYNIKALEDLPSSKVSSVVATYKKKAAKMANLNEQALKDKEKDETLNVLNENNNIKFKSIDTVSGETKSLTRTHAENLSSEIIIEGDEIDNNVEEKVVDEKAVEEKVVDEKAVDEKVVDEKVVDEKAVDEKVLDEKAVDEKAVDEKVVDKPKKTPAKKNPRKKKKAVERIKIDNNLDESDEISL